MTKLNTIANDKLERFIENQPDTLSVIQASISGYFLATALQLASHPTTLHYAGAAVGGLVGYDFMAKALKNSSQKSLQKKIKPVAAGIIIGIAVAAAIDRTLPAPVQTPTKLSPRASKNSQIINFNGQKIVQPLTAVHRINFSPAGN